LAVEVLRAGAVGSAAKAAPLAGGVASRARRPVAGPRSHASPHSGMPSPHRSIRQVCEQPSQSVRLPSSHSSPASSSRTLLPQRTSRQTASQLSPEVPFAAPSSHSSPGRSMRPSPHPVT